MTTFCITGSGMVTSLGHDAITSCAAARAGIVRPSERDDFPVRSPEDGSVGALVVHAVPMLTEGFEGQARLQRLAAAALKDLLHQTMHAPWKQGRSAFYLSLPDPRRVYTGCALIPDEEERNEKEAEAREIMAEPLNNTWAHSLFLKAAQLAGWPGTPDVRYIATAGNTGVAQALDKVLADLRAGTIDCAVVGGVDSLLDEETLVWLENTLRLKTPDMPVGLQPGEAAAFFTVEAPARGDSAKTLTHIQALHVGMETRSLFSGDPPLGQGLATLIEKTANGGRRNDGPAPWFITDQNGEPYRAMEWGQAVVRLIKDWPELDNAVLWYPAMSFGDTGAANGAVAVCLAVRALERGYAPQNKAILYTSSDQQIRTSILLENLKWEMNLT